MNYMVRGLNPYLGGAYGLNAYGRTQARQRQATIQPRKHELKIRDTDDSLTKFRKEIINRVNTAGETPQTSKGTRSYSYDQGFSAADLQELYYRMQDALGGMSFWG